MGRLELQDSVLTNVDPRKKVGKRRARGPNREYPKSLEIGPLVASYRPTAGNVVANRRSYSRSSRSGSMTRCGS
jgi:hypothetical protein